MGCIENVLSSACTPASVNGLQARQFSTYTGRHTKACYLHICEGATHFSDGRKSETTGKLISYLLSDFVKGVNER